jgi:hypothetical protein
MPRPSSANQRTEGFVLLYTLWLLLAGVAAFAVLSRIVLQRSAEVAAESGSLTISSAMDSALHTVAYELLSQPRAAWSASELRERTFNDVRVSTRMRTAAGLLDLNGATPASLRTMVASIGIADASTVAGKIVAARPIRAYAQLSTLTGMTPWQHDCLRRLASLTGSPPVSPTGPPSVSREVVQRVDSVAAASAESIAGSAIRVFVTATAQRDQTLIVDLLFTGKADRPVLITAWDQELPATGTLKGCSLELHNPTSERY